MKTSTRSIYNSREKRRELLYRIFFRSEENVLWTTNTETITTTYKAPGSELNEPAEERKESIETNNCSS